MDKIIDGTSEKIIVVMQAFFNLIAGVLVAYSMK
jgi:hypothetical protein